MKDARLKMQDEDEVNVKKKPWGIKYPYWD